MHCVTMPPETRILNISKPNSNGPTLRLQLYNGPSSATHYGSSRLPSARPCPNSITNGYPFRTDIMSKVLPLITLVLLAGKSPKPQPISLHALTMSGRIYGKNSTTNYSNIKSRTTSAPSSTTLWCLGFTKVDKLRIT